MIDIYRLRLRSPSTYFLASMPNPPPPRAVVLSPSEPPPPPPPLTALIPNELHIALPSLLLPCPAPEAEAPEPDPFSPALRTRNATRCVCSTVLAGVNELGMPSVLIAPPCESRPSPLSAVSSPPTSDPEPPGPGRASSRATDGGMRSQTTHQPRAVLLVRSRAVSPLTPLVADKLARRVA